MHSSRTFRPGLVTLSVLLAPLALSAQADRGSIRGQILDEQRSNVPNATLTLLNEETGVTARSTSSSTGAFNFNNLNPGLYTLTTVETGFGTRVQEHIVVAVGTTTPLDLVLKPASVQETVVVTSTGVGVETQTSEIGTVVTPREIVDLPVPMSNDSRNPLSFVALTPGVAGSTPGAQPDYRLHISGSPSDSNEVYIDGVPIISTNLQGDVSLDHPPIDAVGEFKVVNNNQSAQLTVAVKGDGLVGAKLTAARHQAGCGVVLLCGGAAILVSLGDVRGGEMAFEKRRLIWTGLLCGLPAC